MVWGGLGLAAWVLHVVREGMERGLWLAGVPMSRSPKRAAVFSLQPAQSHMQWKGGGLGWAEEQKVRFGAASGGLLSPESISCGLH